MLPAAAGPSLSPNADPPIRDGLAPPVMHTVDGFLISSASGFPPPKRSSA